MAFKTSKRRGEVAIALVLLALAVHVLWMASNMPVGSLASPGPGFFPIAISALLGIVSLAMLGQALLEQKESSGVVLGHREIVLTTVALIALTVVFETAGAFPALGAFLLVLFKVLAKVAWWNATLLAALCTAGLWFVFSWLLGVQLPAGVF